VKFEEPNASLRFRLNIKHPAKLASAAGVTLLSISIQARPLLANRISEPLCKEKA
jgi:hypothetical protein